MGFDNVVVTNNSSADLKDVFSECFDIVIVDAPCSGEGMMRKNMEARKQWSKSLVSSMSKIQKQLLIDAYDMLKIGGTLVYSTCTFSTSKDMPNYSPKQLFQFTLPPEFLYAHISHPCCCQT